MFPRSAAVFAAGCVAAAVSCVRGEPKLAQSVGGQPTLAVGVGVAAEEPQKPSLEVEPARIFPDVSASSTGFIATQPDGTRRLIIAGIRLIEHPDGSLERARETLPGGVARVVNLPQRLGGGMLFYVAAGGSTQVWRAKGWLDRLDPLGEIWGTVSEIIAGFDRLYARLTSGDIKAIDPSSGRQVALGPLPRATRIGQLAFADAWRAVALVDFRGVLATFDAGNTWRAVPVGDQGVTQIALRQGDFVLDSPRQRVVLGPRGEIESSDPPTEGPRGREAATDPNAGAFAANDTFAHRASGYARGLGRRPLRAAIEDGFPFAPTAIGAKTAVFAESGTLYRVELRSGAIVTARTGAFREDDGACHAIQIGSGFGFVCGRANAGTAVYAFSLPFDLQEVARFAHPRMVVASGAGGFVVRGGCARDSVASSDAFCFFGPHGESREIATPGATRRENARIHPVPLGDGRALFLLAPDGETPGKIYVERGPTFAVTSLAPPPGQSIAKQGDLLAGVEERAPGVLGGWVLAGTELRGVRIQLDGKMEIGALGANIERTSVAGRFAVEWGRAGRGMETVDGGMTFRPIDFPSVDVPVSPILSTAAGPVGATQGTWLRVGWGSSHESPDLVAAPIPKPSRVALTLGRGVALRCYPTGEVSGPLSKPPPPPSSSPAATRVVTRKPPASSSRGGPSPTVAPVQPMQRPRYPPIFTPTPPKPVATSASASGVTTPWTAFRGDPAPSLAPGDVGVDAGTDPPHLTQARVYAWGARGAEWALKGHLLARFDDRFERIGTRSTAVGLAPWTNEERAGDALGVTAGQTVNWSAILDGGGQGALLIGQRGVARADLYAAAQGQPLILFRNADLAPLPVPSSVVRMGSTWFFLVSTMNANTWGAAIYRADGGVVRRLARLPRIPVPAGEFIPRLMRRAQSQGLGILVQGAPGFEQVIRDWYVLPLDAETGELDEPIRLFGSDLEGVVPERCAADRDGWVVNTDLSMAPAIQILTTAPANVSSIELRLRLDPGTACVDAMAARAEGLVTPSSGPAYRLPPGTDGSTFDLPLAATDTSSGRRWTLQCGK